MGKIREEMEKVARENAIKDLKELQIDIGSSPDDLEQSPLYYALDIAIKALEQKPRQGHWIEVTNGRGGHECDVCHDYAPSFQNGDEYLSAFCPNCGADMREVNNEDE